MPYCSAVNCTNRLAKGCRKTFHRFPKSDPALRKRWTVNMRRDHWTPKSHSTLCSDHFEEKHFNRTGQRTRLRTDAVPTLFNFPQHLMKTAKQRKTPFPRNPVQGVQPEQQNDTPASTIDELSTVSEDLVCDTLANTVVSTPIKPVPMDTDGPMLMAPRTPPKQSSSYDHTYSIRESPRSLKLKLDMMYDHILNAKKRLKTTQTRVCRLKKKVKSLLDVVQTLKEKNMLSESGLEMLEKTCNVPAVIIKKLAKTKDKNAPSREMYPPALRAFALTLNFYSAKAYRFVRKTFNLQLPHPSIIRKWYSNIDGKPGFTAESFSTLEEKVREANERGQELVCGLMLDEMAISSEVGQGNIFSSLSRHMYDSPADLNHIFFLIKKIAASYLTIRMHYLAKHRTESISGPNIRKELSKLILFRHH